jgi:hypothetical protein
MAVIYNLSTSRLIAKQAAAETAGDWDLAEQCEEELDRRAADDSDPASPQNTEPDARDSEPYDVQRYER